MWDSEVVPLLHSAPKLMAITLLRKLQDDHPDRFPDGVLRTLQRHIRRWRALEGPPKEVFFPQDHAPGHRGLSDFTAMCRRVNNLLLMGALTLLEQMRPSP